MFSAVPGDGQFVCVNPCHFVRPQHYMVGAGFHSYLTQADGAFQTFLQYVESQACICIRDTAKPACELGTTEGGSECRCKVIFVSTEKR